MQNPRGHQEACGSHRRDVPRSDSMGPTLQVTPACRYLLGVKYGPGLHRTGCGGDLPWCSMASVHVGGDHCPPGDPGKKTKETH